jgi:hypothetical protein
LGGAGLKAYIAQKRLKNNFKNFVKKIIKTLDKRFFFHYSGV